MGVGCVCGEGREGDVVEGTPADLEIYPLADFGGEVEEREGFGGHAELFVGGIVLLLVRYV